MKPQMLPFIFIGIIASSSSIPRALYLSVGSSHTLTPNALSWFGFNKDLSISMPKYKPCPVSIKTVEPSSKSTSVTAVQIGTSDLDSYESRNGDTVHTLEVKYIGLKFFPKQIYWHGYQSLLDKGHNKSPHCHDSF